jgi:general stress protein 26
MSETAAPGDPMRGDTARDWEDVRSYTLEEEQEAELLARQTECTFIWLAKDGHPMGVVMNYLPHDGRFWLTATQGRPRIAAVRRDPRVSIAITSKGSGIAVSRSLSYKGSCVVHEDDATKAWFYPAFAARLRPDDAVKAASFAAHLDSPGRVVLEIVPDRRIGFDSAKMWAAAPSAGPAPAHGGTDG